MSDSFYLLSMVNHKETYELTDEVTLHIDKRFENNLRERNPQLGRVECIGDDNPYGLEVGDIVAVNHFTFYGDIGSDKGYILKDHVEVDGVKLFKAVLR